MQIWTVEYRTLLPSELFGVTIFFVASSYEKAENFVKENLKELDSDSWFCITSDIVDEDLSGSIICSIDRLGHLSKQFQPVYPPHLLEEWDEELG